MALPDLTDALERWSPRLLANGVDWSDLSRAVRAAGANWTGWYRQMVRRGEEHAGLARAALAEGRNLTAGEAWVRAGLLYHFAQFALFDFPDLQADGQRLKEAAFARAGPLLNPPIERMEVPWGGDHLPVVLRRPTAPPGPLAWVLLVPGLDSTKEEFFTFARVFLDRGLAVAAFDGPGQGELAARGRRWRPGDESAATAVLAALRRTPGLAPQRCGILGVSFGGYLALAAAALAGETVQACAGIGGCFRLGDGDWERLPPLIQADFRHFCGAPGDVAARAAAARVSLADRLPHLGCPLLLCHGDRDGIFPPDHARRAAQAAGDRAELHILPDGNHVCNNLPHHYRPYVADWFARRLTEGGNAHVPRV